MKIIILLIAVIVLFAGAVKKTVDDIEKIAVRSELKLYPNLLPTVEVVAKRLPGVR